MRPAGIASEQALDNGRWELHAAAKTGPVYPAFKDPLGKNSRAAEGLNGF